MNTPKHDTNEYLKPSVDEHGSVEGSAPQNRMKAHPFVDGFLMLGLAAVWFLTLFGVMTSSYVGLYYAVPISLLALLLYKLRTHSGRKFLIFLLRAVLLVVAVVALAGAGLCAMFLTGNMQM